jgi:hypothetical protein
MLVSIGSYVLELSKLGSGKAFVPSIYQFTRNNEEREMLKLGLVKPNSYACPLNRLALRCRIQHAVGGQIEGQPFPSVALIGAHENIACAILIGVCRAAAGNRAESRVDDGRIVRMLGQRPHHLLHVCRQPLANPDPFPAFC